MPSSLFKKDGSRRKTNKTDLLHALADTVKKSITKLPGPNVHPSIHLTDAMALPSMLNVGQTKTFQGIGEERTTKIDKLQKFYTEVHFVFDRYDNDDNNPKSEEHQRRQGSVFRQYQVAAAWPIPDWNAFMGVSSSKAQLAALLSPYLEDTIQSRALLTPDKALWLGSGYQNCKIRRYLTYSGVEDVEAYLLVKLK